jgi:hypothetical protein
MEKYKDMKIGMQTKKKKLRKAPTSISERASDSNGPTPPSRPIAMLYKKKNEIFQQE